MVHPYLYVGLNPNTKARIISNKKMIVNTDMVLKIISEERSISIEELTSRSRLRDIVEGRQLFSYILRERFGYPYAKIGHLLRRNHATILYGNKVHQSNYQYDKNYRSLCDRVLKRVNKLFEHEN